MTDDYRGIRRVKEGLVEFLAAELPVRAARLGEAWGVTVPVPVNAPDDPRRHAYFDTQHAATDRYPLLMLTSMRSRSRRVEYDDSPDPVYAVIHSVRLLVWVREEGMAEADKSRDNLTAVITHALLDNQGLVIDGAECLILEDTLTATYAECVPVKGDRFVSAVQIDLDVQVDESVSRPPIGRADTVRLFAGPADEVATHYPPHPALQ